jgi:hypothetical protein
MPRLRAIVLDSPDASTARANFRIALWFDVPAARQKFYAGKKPLGSIWIDALTADNTAITTGAVVEEVINYQPDTAKSAGAMEAEVAGIWTARQAAITAYNVWPNYGSTWDGTVWSIVSVA